MKARPRIGTTGEMKFVVGQEHVIDFATGGMPAVLSTPRLVALIERTARESLYPFLNENERTVGAEIEIRHMAPTPLGQPVTIITRVIATEMRSVDFQFEVRDAHEVIARGLHKRAVITVESFARRVARKTARP
ncbi:MAG: LysR family transcriptional regulator [Pedosphaera sp.]|nr:MAG: LysR family transcriptional regulator [Pedosphaera sp.]